MTETTETTGRCPAQYCRIGTLEQCHLLAGHTGAHRSESYDWPNASALHPVCAADAGEGACIRKPGHTGEHAWRTVTAQALDRGEAWRPRATEDVHLPQRGEEWPPVPCGVTFTGPDGDHTVCNVIAGHIGTHQHLPVDAGEDRTGLPVRERRGVTVSALTRLRPELLGKLDRLEKGVSLRLEALEKSMGSREDHLSLHHTLEVGLYSAIGEVERRMTALEKRVTDWLNDLELTQDEQPEQVTVYGIDVSEWDRRLGTLEKRADQVLERVNKAEHRILRAVESLQAEPMEHARGTVTCDAVGQWRPPTGADPVAVVCTRNAGHTGRCDDQGMTWDALCADTPAGEPWCIQRPGHDGECDPDPSAQVPGPSGRCRAVLLIGESGRYRCTLDQGHDGRHTEN